MDSQFNFYEISDHDYAKRYVLRKKLVSLYSDILDKQFKHPEELDLPDYLKEALIKKSDKQKCLKSTCCMITVNPREGTQIADLIKKINNFCQLKWVSNIYLYALEQRSDGTSPLGRGIHVHILIHRESTLAPSIIRKETQRCFAKLVDQPTNTALINFHFGDDVYLKNAQKYIMGTKVDDAKKLKSICDKQWRDANKLSQYYQNGFVATDEIPLYKPIPNPELDALEREYKELCEREHREDLARMGIKLN